MKYVTFFKIKKARKSGLKTDKLLGIRGKPF